MHLRHGGSGRFSLSLEIPNGESIFGGTQVVRLNAPYTSGRCAMRGGLVSTLHCSMIIMGINEGYTSRQQGVWKDIPRKLWIFGEDRSVVGHRLLGANMERKLWILEARIGWCKHKTEC
jgi:hypothetical protein